MRSYPSRPNLMECFAKSHRARRAHAGGSVQTMVQQFVSKLLGDTCESLDLIHERIPSRSPNMNAYIESFHSVLERHLFSRRDFMTLDKAYEALDQYMDFYNNRKIHGSLRQMSSMQFSMR